jgi:hypothetical protein
MLSVRASRAAALAGVLMLPLGAPPWAQTPESTRLAILRDINADGALIALALHCKHAPDDVNRLGDKLETLTLARAKEQAVALDANTYHEAARDGFMHMREVLAVAMPAEDTYRTQCAEVAERVGKAMAR